jgi:hypothetical protein
MTKIKLIAHRGLYQGPDKTLENRPDQILYAIDEGYDCEIDLWKTGNKLYLGHDIPQYEVTTQFLEQEELWIHAKNIDALYWLASTEAKYFWHQEDDFTLTSNGYIWTYPDKPLTNRSIRVMPEWKDPELKTILDFHCYAICSDYVERIREIINQ